MEVSDSGISLNYKDNLWLIRINIYYFQGNLYSEPINPT